MCVGESKDSIEYEECNERHCDWKGFFYVVEETEGENDIDSPPEDEVECEEVGDGEVVNFKECVEFAEDAVRGFSGDFMRHEGENKFTEWLTSYFEKSRPEDETQKAIENPPPHTQVKEK